MSFTFVNCDIYDGRTVIPDGALKTAGSSIAFVGERSAVQSDGEVIDLRGLSVAPGFIDIQVNGGGDVLFNDDPSTSTLHTIVEAHAKFGTTSIMPTYITGPADGMVRARAAVLDYMAAGSTAILGIHFEGPSISPVKLGVHDKDFARPDFPTEVLGSPGELLHLITLAPEVVDKELIASLVRSGARVAVGHSNATYDEAVRALHAGATLATHLFNAMSQLTARDPGVVGAFLSTEKSYVDVIVDGFHCHFASVGAAWRAKTKGRCFLVTDAMPPVGGTGKGYTLGPWTVRVEDGRCITEDGVLAGSGLDMASAVRNCVQKVGIAKDEALRMASLYPANYLGVADRLGRLAPGYVANAVVFDNQIGVRGVICDGVPTLAL